MTKTDLKAIVLRREIVNIQGKRLEIKKSGWQRCYLVLKKDHLRIWSAGGILLDDLSALEEIENEMDPIDEINLRIVHIQKIPDKNTICLHFTEGMQRVLLKSESDDEGRTIEAWSSIFLRSIRESILLDQHKTSIFLHTNRTDDEVLSYTNKTSNGIFDETLMIEYKWPGNSKYNRCALGIKMKAGWKDSRVVSKRCISLYNEEDQGNNFKKLIANISPLTSFHILSEHEGVVVLEGNAQYHRNDPFVAPIAERILVKPLQIDELKRFLLFLRDSFEIILPRPQTAFQDSSDSVIKFQNISVQAQTRDEECKKKLESLAELVQPKPWQQLDWNDLYNYYKLKNFKNSHLSPIDFTLKFKQFGFCLKTISGSVVTCEDLLKIQSTADVDALTSMYWNHLGLNYAN